MKKRILAFMLVLLLAVCLYAQAVETPVLTIRLTVPEETKSELYSIGMEMSVYKIADIEDGALTYADSFSELESSTVEGSEEFAEEALDIVLKAESPIDHKTLTGPEYSLSDLDANAVYLLVAGDGNAIVTEEIEGNTAVVIDTPLDIYRFSPILLVTKDETEVDIELKYEVEDKVGDLIIKKTLAVYNEDSDATFAFEIRWGGKTQKVDGISFTEAGEKTIRISGVPLGETVTVTEIYEGANYSCTSEKTVETVILPLEEEPNETEETSEAQPAQSAGEIPTAEVEFVNIHSDDGDNGGGIVNRFTYVNGEWVLKQD